MTIRKYLNTFFPHRTLAEISEEIFGNNKSIALLSKLRNNKYKVDIHSNSVDVITNYAKLKHGIDVEYQTNCNYNNSESDGILQRRDLLIKQKDAEIEELQSIIKNYELKFEKIKEILKNAD